MINLDGLVKLMEAVLQNKFEAFFKILKIKIHQLKIKKSSRFGTILYISFRSNNKEGEDALKYAYNKLRKLSKDFFDYTAEVKKDESKGSV